MAWWMGMSMGPGGGGFYSGSHGYYDDRDQGYDSRRGGRSRGYPNEEHSPDAQRMFMELFPQILGEIVQKNSGQQQMLQQQMLQQQMYDHQIYQQQAYQQGLHAQHMYESANRRREARARREDRLFGPHDDVWDQPAKPWVMPTPNVPTKYLDPTKVTFEK